MKKIVDGKIIDLSAAEIEEREAFIAAELAARECWSKDRKVEEMRALYAGKPLAYRKYISGVANDVISALKFEDLELATSLVEDVVVPESMASVKTEMLNIINHK